jgi:hypothetical protein
VLLAGCAIASEDKSHLALTAREPSRQEVYKLYPGSTRPPGELAVLLMGDVPSATVDGLQVRRTDYQVIHLLPGEHAVSWRQAFGFSVMVEPAMTKSAERTVSVDLEAGHTYTLFADRTYGAQYQLYFRTQYAATNPHVVTPLLDALVEEIADTLGTACGHPGARIAILAAETPRAVR